MFSLSFFSSNEIITNKKEMDINEIKSLILNEFTEEETKNTIKKFIVSNAMHSKEYFNILLEIVKTLNSNYYVDNKEFIKLLKLLFFIRYKSINVIDCLKKILEIVDFFNDKDNLIFDKDKGKDYTEILSVIFNSFNKYEFNSFDKYESANIKYEDAIIIYEKGFIIYGTIGKLISLNEIELIYKILLNLKLANSYKNLFNKENIHLWEYFFNEDTRLEDLFLLIKELNISILNNFENYKEYIEILIIAKEKNSGYFTKKLICLIYELNKSPLNNILYKDKYINLLNYYKEEEIGCKNILIVLESLNLRQLNYKKSFEEYINLCEIFTKNFFDNNHFYILMYALNNSPIKKNSTLINILKYILNKEKIEETTVRILFFLNESIYNNYEDNSKYVNILHIILKKNSEKIKKIYESLNNEKNKETIQKKRNEIFFNILNKEKTIDEGIEMEDMSKIKRNY